MKKFALFVLKFIAVIGLTYGAYYALFWFLWQSELCPDAYSHAYQKALLLQYQALAGEDREPETIIFGSSYVPFGIDVSVMEKEMGEPVQILGIEAGIGIPVLVDILHETAKPGDTIVYMLGKSNWYNEDFMVISAALESDKERLRHYWSLREGMLEPYRTKMIWRKMYALFAGDLVEKIRTGISKKEQVYSLDSFDERGNMTARREGTLIDTDVSPSDTLNMADMELDTLDMLNEFSAWCGERDITFVIAYAMTIDGSLKETEEELAQYHEQMTEYMNADILGVPQDYFLPVEMFYNHEAHLNSEGAEKYSRILAEKILEYRDGN